MSARDVIAQTNDQNRWGKIGTNNADAILSALTAAGYAVVPREPTVEQFEAARERDQGIVLNENGTVPYSGYGLIYRAMLAAGEATP